MRGHLQWQELVVGGGLEIQVCNKYGCKWSWWVLLSVIQKTAEKKGVKAAT